MTVRLRSDDMHLYRHDAIQTTRPFGFGLDDNGRLWEGCFDGLYMHDSRTARCEHIRPVAMMDKFLSEVMYFKGELIAVHGVTDHYSTFNPSTGVGAVHALPGERTNIWYGCKAAGKVLMFDRSDRGGVLIIDEPGGPVRKIENPWGYVGIASGRPIDDTTVLMTKSGPMGIVLFDADREEFIEAIESPYPDADASGPVCHGDRLYLADTSGGRLVVFDRASKTWLDPIPTPDHGDVYGFIGGSFQFGSVGYFCLSSYRSRSRVDPRTGALIVPEGADIGVDGRPHHFLDRFLSFDAETQTFDYLEVPEQDDGYPLVCYSYTDGERVFITGHMMPFGTDGHPNKEPGDWLVWQNFPADVDPFDASRLTLLNRTAHIRSHCRAVPRGRGLYREYQPHTPPTSNMERSAVGYPIARCNELQRRLARTDCARYWRELANLLAAGTDSDQQRVEKVGRYVQQNVYYNPVSEPDIDPVAALECGDARCGLAMLITLNLLNGMGVKVRDTELNHHVVNEVYYDDAWHIQDSLIFGDRQPIIDGRVPSVEQLRGDLYFADAMPQTCFDSPPEELRSADGFQILGYQFGEWGWSPFYSTYLGADWDCPPTLPVTLPAERLDDQTVRLRWAESIRRGGGEIEYRLRIYEDRDLTELADEFTTSTNHYVYQPRPMRMVYYSVSAVDEHRALNPETWYPCATGNFVLAPRDQYGWYGAV